MYYTRSFRGAYRHMQTISADLTRSVAYKYNVCWQS